jgi:glycosyltransferase involved in cell wall biosynthesis
MAPALSICIPTYEMGGLGAHYLDLSLKILAKQDFSDFEVVISDQSNDDAVANLCALRSQDMDIRHIWNRDGRRLASANVNNAMTHATGPILKILFQDDFLSGNNALSQIHQAMDQSGKWLLCGSCVTRDGITQERPMVPRLTEKLQFGKNTVSSPSVLAMHRDFAMQFDETLIWLMDVELYKRLWDSHGDPVILSDPLVVNRLHEGQVSASISKQLRHKELRYIRAKFADSTSFRGRMEYLRQRLKAL